MTGEGIKTMKQQFPWRSAAVGAALAMAGNLLCCALTALLTVKEVVPEAMMMAINRLPVLAVLLGSCLWATGRAGKNRMQTALLLGGIYLVLCALLGLLLGGEMKLSIWPILVMGICALSGVIASMPKQRHR